MKNKKNIATLYEEKTILKCLLRGDNLKQIAKELNCAKSTASYKAKKMYEKYHASDRHEFVINLFSKLVAKYKNEIVKLNQEIENLKK